MFTPWALPCTAALPGSFPPDSVERIHGDTMKRPSELGFRIPANVENAIMKALAVKTEDRFPNMEAFIGALNGARFRTGSGGGQH